MATMTTQLQPGYRRHELTPAEARLVGRYDHVSHLPNRVQFNEDFPALFAGDGNMLMLVTLAEARHYNEVLRALGIAFADDFVRAGIERLRALLPADAPLYQVSVLSIATTLPADAVGEIPAVVREIVRAFAEPLVVSCIPVKSRVGVGLLPDGARRSPVEALRGALVAAQDSRRVPEGFAFYDNRTDARHLRGFRLLSDLPAALAADDQLSLVYQPRQSLGTDACHSAEALIRWRHPEFGHVSPGEFIPLVEQTALIAPLTEWVCRTAVDRARRLHAAGTPISLSVNASPVNLSEPGFADLLLHSIDAAGLSPTSLELEFTEGTLATNSTLAVAQLTRLRQSGVTIALDDFGSGYSNLAYLRSIPADVVKIDQSFVRPLIREGDDEFLLSRIVDMTRGLGFRICAEGIETGYAYERLRSLGVDEGQGYFIARPMPGEALGNWLAAR